MKLKNLLFFSLFCSAFTFVNAQEIKKDSTITLMAVGDIMLGTTFPNKNYLPPKNVYPFEKVLLIEITFTMSSNKQQLYQVIGE